jgi:hypothetical protein
VYQTINWCRAQEGERVRRIFFFYLALALPLYNKFYNKQDVLHCRKYQTSFPVGLASSATTYDVQKNM